MKTFSTFLSEAKENLKPVVMAFGRMNPPTTGHAKLVDKVHELAKEHNAHHEVIVSHSQDKEKNPLSQEQKIKHAKRFFPHTNIVGSSKEHPSFIAHAKRLNQAGHQHLIMVAGSDRVPEYQRVLNTYNGKEFHYKKISVVSAGHRDPDAEGTEGMSASKMRHHASTGNYSEFKKGIPSHVPEHHAKELYNDVRKGMGLHEAVGHINTNYADYYFGNAGDYPKDKQDETALGTGVSDGVATQGNAAVLDPSLNMAKRPDLYREESAPLKSQGSTRSGQASVGPSRGTPQDHAGHTNLHQKVRNFTDKKAELAHNAKMELSRATTPEQKKVVQAKVKNEKDNIDKSVNSLRRQMRDRKMTIKPRSEDVAYAGAATMNTPYYGKYDKVANFGQVGEDLDAMVESHLFGSDAARAMYSSMTPGQESYTSKKKYKADAYNTRQGEVSPNPPRDINKEVLPKKAYKKLRDEDYLGPDYNSRLSGAARSSGGLGGAWSIAVQEQTMLRLQAWRNNPQTVSMFESKFGNQANQKLDETVEKMFEKLMEKKNIQINPQLNIADNIEDSMKTLREFKEMASKKHNEDKLFDLQDMGSGSDGDEPPPETGYAKQKTRMEKVNEDEMTFHGEEHELIESCQWDEESDPIEEATYQGRAVKLGKPTTGDVKKSKVYVKGPSGRVVKVNFGDPNMTIKKNIPARRKSFRARHHCDTNPGPRWKARYWSCRAW